MKQRNIFDVMADVTDALFDFNMDQTAENEKKVDDAVEVLVELKRDVKGDLRRLADSIFELAVDFTD